MVFCFPPQHFLASFLCVPTVTRNRQVILMTCAPHLTRVFSLAQTSYHGSLRSITWWLAQELMEAEYRVLAHTTSCFLWLESFLQELHVSFMCPTLLSDKLSTFLLSHNSIIHYLIKHIELVIYFMREHIIFKLLNIQHVPASMKVTDTLTKPLRILQF